MKRLIGEAAEILKGAYKGSPLWLFNVTRHVAKPQIGDLDDNAIFRVSPTGLSILCGSGFKNAVEGSGLTGLKFRIADEIAMV